MSVSPADFELYSRVTGTPLPRTPAEQMQMAPYVHNFIRSQGYAEPNIVQRTAGTLGKLALLGAAGAGLYGLTKLGTEGTVTSTANGDNNPPPPPGDPNGSGDLPPSKEERQHQHQVEHYDSPEYLDNQAMEAIGRDDYREERFGIPGDTTTDSSITLRDQADNLVNQYENGSGNIEIDSQYKPLSGWDRHRGAVEKWADDITLEQKVASSAGPLTGAVVAKNLVDFGTIAAGGESMGGPVQEAFTEGANRVGLALADKDPGFRAVHGALDAAKMTGQQAFDTFSGWGFGPGHTVGDVLQYVGQHGANLPGVEGLGNVVEGLQHVAHTLPIEVALGVGGAATGAALIGGARGVRKAGEVLDAVIDKGKSDIKKGKKDVERFQRVWRGEEKTITAEEVKDGLLKVANPAFKQQQETQNVDEVGQEHDLNDQPQIPDPDQKISDENRVTPQESIQANDDPWFSSEDQKVQDLTANFNKSLAHLPPEKRVELAKQMARKEAGGGVVDAVKSFVRGLTGPLDETWEDVQAGTTPLPQETPRVEVPNESRVRPSRMERIRAMEQRYAQNAQQLGERMEYNPAAPKLPGDEIQIGDGNWSRMTTNPSEWLKRDDVPDSAYKQKVPREEDEVPAWWTV